MNKLQENLWNSNNELHATIGLTKSEVNIIINGMSLVLSQNENDLSESAKAWYTHIKNVFETFRECNY